MDSSVSVQDASVHEGVGTFLLLCAIFIFATTRIGDVYLAKMGLIAASIRYICVTWGAAGPAVNPMLATTFALYTTKVAKGSFCCLLTRGPSGCNDSGSDIFTNLLRTGVPLGCPALLGLLALIICWRRSRHAPVVTPQRGRHFCVIRTRLYQVHRIDQGSMGQTRCRLCLVEQR